MGLKQKTTHEAPAAVPVPTSELMGVPGHPGRPNFERIGKMNDLELVATIQSIGKDHGDIEKAAILDPLLREACDRGLDTETPLPGLSTEAQVGHTAASSTGTVMELAQSTPRQNVDWVLINRTLREYGHLMKSSVRGFSLGDLADAILQEVHRGGEQKQPTGRYALGQRFEFRDRQHVICNGYSGVVTKKLEGMVEVQLKSGVACVTANFPDCYPDDRFSMVEELKLEKEQRFANDLEGGPARRLLPPNDQVYTVYADPAGILHDRKIPVDKWRLGDGWVNPKEFEASGLEWEVTADVGLLREGWMGHKAGSLVISGMFKGKDWDGSQESIEAIAIRPRTREDNWLEAGAGAKTTSPKKVLKNTLRESLEKGVAFNEEPKESFHREGKRVLHALATELGLKTGEFDLRSNKGGVAVSGEITLHTDKIYVQISEGIGKGMEVLFRTCEGRRDYTGGRNNFAPVEDLARITDFALRLKNLKN